jgi:hypothetical protein
MMMYSMLPVGGPPSRERESGARSVKLTGGFTFLAIASHPEKKLVRLLPVV